MKRLLFALAALCLLWEVALAEPRAYTYGGSGMDFLINIAASEDGRIALTGYTDSVDGTLAGRAEAGQSGWLLCVDAQGNILINFHTRRGIRDCLRFPVFHEDGSLTAVLDVESAGEQELIRFDREGNVLMRTQILPSGGETAVSVVGATQEGYLFYEKSGMFITRVFLFDWEASLLQSWAIDDAPDDIARAERHAIRDEQGECYLVALGEFGEETRLAKVMAWTEDEGWDVYFDSLVSLADGGAAAAGYSSPGEDGAQSGCLARWDAQGNPVFAWWLPGEIPHALERTPRGFAAAVSGAASANGLREEALAFFDEDGMQTGRVPLGSGTGYCQTVTLPDGGIAALIPFVPGEHREPIDLDARLVIIPPEDFL